MPSNLSFTKLFSTITESTIWAESHPTRIVWITMLAMADWNGQVFGSIPGLANRARVTLEECEAALTRFQEPDRYSRTKANEGRRIEAIEGGWRILNHAKFREVRHAEATKASKRDWWHRNHGTKLDGEFETRPDSTHNRCQIADDRLQIPTPDVAPSVPAPVAPGGGLVDSLDQNQPGAPGPASPTVALASWTTPPAISVAEADAPGTRPDQVASLLRFTIGAAYLEWYHQGEPDLPAASFEQLVLQLLNEKWSPGDIFITITGGWLWSVDGPDLVPGSRAIKAKLWAQNCDANLRALGQTSKAGHRFIWHLRQELKRMLKDFHQPTLQLFGTLTQAEAVQWWASELVQRNADPDEKVSEDAAGRAARERELETLAAKQAAVRNARRKQQGNPAPCDQAAVPGNCGAPAERTPSVNSKNRIANQSNDKSTTIIKSVAT